jgi:hypothetical protein
MFSRNEMLAALPQILESSNPPMTILSFDADDFVTSCSEESIRICQGSRSNFDSAIQFWVKVIQHHLSENPEYLVPYLQRAKCRGISKKKFNQITQCCGGLRKRITLPLREDNFASAMQMYDRWDDVAALAEYADEYIAFHWTTTA